MKTKLFLAVIIVIAAIIGFTMTFIALYGFGTISEWLISVLSADIETIIDVGGRSLIILSLILFLGVVARYLTIWIKERFFTKQDPDYPIPVNTDFSQLSEDQKNWVRFLQLEQPTKDKRVLIRNLKLLKASYEKWKLVNYPKHTRKNDAIIKRAYGLRDTYHCLITSFTIADDKDITTPKLESFFESSEMLVSSIENFSRCTDPNDFVEKEMELSTLIVEMEVEMLEYTRFLRDAIQIDSFSHRHSLPSVATAAEEMLDDEAFIIFFADLFSDNKDSSNTIAAA